tara:strand:+ start:1418 stop:1801 length:384 start_codon:yes stop_codon:yes gene_type:complete
MPDIPRYIQRDYGPLTTLYARAEISATDPQARAEFLAETVFDGLTMTDHDLLMRASSRTEALNMLEDWVIAAHKADQEWIQENIPVPLNLERQSYPPSQKTLKTSQASDGSCLKKCWNMMKPYLGMS